MSGEISGETLKFIRTCFTSVWALELLLMMRRECTKIWSIGELTQELRASDLIVREALPELVNCGLVAETGREMFQYRPVESTLEQLVNRVAAAYSQNRMQVVEEILNARAANIRMFANAFKLKKDDK
jgi:DNA-binding FadR family transcriptional regulator